MPIDVLLYDPDGGVTPCVCLRIANACPRMFCCGGVRSRGKTCVDTVRRSEKLSYHFNSRWLTYLTARLT
jgi:hypothetical protein